MVVNKPPGIYCETVLSSARNMLDELSSPANGVGRGSTPPELHLANRLDRDTSGLMVVTKSHRVAAKLVKAFTEHKVRKTYIALCIGQTPKWERINIQSGHGRSKFGVWRVYAASDVGRSLPGGSVVRDMATSFEILSVNGQGSFREPTKLTTAENNGIETFVVEDEGLKQKSGVGNEMRDEILIRAYPRSGRTHQIRLHCQYLGIPIRGDVKYGVHEWGGRTFNVHALHAESLEFDHPVMGIPVEFRAPLPSWATTAACQGNP
ncbi:hypothetical protein ACLOJK_026447 [Asimina triloba]